MVLLIDIGNSNIVLGLAQSQKILHKFRMRTDANMTSDEIERDLFFFMQRQAVQIEDIEGSIISTVVPILGKVYAKILKKLLGKEAIIIGPGVKTGLSIRIDHPNQLGSDLVVAAVGALAKFRGPLVIFDLGTASTVSVIDENGHFIGGQIHAGLKMSLNALAANTAQLPSVDLETTVPLIGKNTVDCLRSGVIFGHACILDGIIRRLKQSYPTIEAVATGGLVSYILPHCEEKITYLPDLLLEGLYKIYERNRLN